MSYIQRELTEGERLILLGRVSWWTIVPHTLLAIAVFAVVMVVGSMAGLLGAVFFVVAVPVVVLLWLAMISREVYRVLKASRQAAALPTGADDPLRFGVRALRLSLEQMVSYALAQQLITRRVTADELFADAVRVLGAEAD